MNSENGKIVIDMEQQRAQSAQETTRPSVLLSKEECPCETTSGIHARMLAATLGAFPAVFQDLTDLPQGAIHLEEGGTAYATVGDFVVICLPAIKNRADAALVYTDLLRIFEVTDCSSHWIVDFSAVTSRPPILLLGTLKGYAHTLGIHGKRIHFVWLRESLFSSSILPSIKISFGLTVSGGYLFSAGGATGCAGPQETSSPHPKRPEAQTLAASRLRS